MGKTRAEIQRAYRERKKTKEGKSYLKKETERVKTYYKPTSDLAPNKLRVKRERARKCMQARRKQEKQLASKQTTTNTSNQPEIVNQNEAEEDNGPCDSTCSPVQSTSGNAQQSLVVKMNFKNKRGCWKKSKHIQQTRTEIRKLEMQVKSLQTRNNTLRQKIRRSQIAAAKCPTNMKVSSKEILNCKKETPQKRKSDALLENLTPKSRSVKELRNEGLSPSKHPKLVKQLTFHNSIVDEVNKKLEPERGRARQRSTLQVVCGSIIKKYRMRSKMCRSFEVNRRQVKKSEDGLGVQKHRNILKRRHMLEKVRAFLEREDSSSCLPGKQDCKKTKDGVVQVRVLNDYLYNLHMKFKAENPDVEISLTTFSSYRPKNIKLVKFSARRTCLCQKHQNVSLKVKGLRSAGIVNTNSPDVLIRQYSDDQIIQNILSSSVETIKYSEWKRKDVEHRGKITKRMQVQVSEILKHDFVELFRKDLSDFRKHTERVRCQYEQVKALKERMPANHVVCQMDFAENYSCGHADEVQSAYFDKCSVTLHPVVIYMKNNEDKLNHMSYIYISDTPAHNSGTVYAFMRRITQNLKETNPDVKCIHYITDSPTSQYRNKNIMYLVANHKEMFGIQASWQYFEAGHGKGPCDGVGGTSKRLADSAVKRQTTVIQSAEDYYNWGNSLEKGNIKYIFVPKEECEKAHTEFSSLNIKPIKGTLEIHSVVPIKQGEIAVRATSCFCSSCFEDGHFFAKCNGWNFHSFTSDISDNIGNENGISNEGTVAKIVSQNMSDGNRRKQFEEGRYVAAIYNERWYIGKVINYDPSDSDLQYQISFMVHNKNKGSYTFKWPAHDDIIWVNVSDILCSVSDPVPYGSRERYKLPKQDVEEIEKLKNRS